MREDGFRKKKIFFLLVGRERQDKTRYHLLLNATIRNSPSVHLFQLARRSKLELPNEYFGTDFAYP